MKVKENENTGEEFRVEFDMDKYGYTMDDIRGSRLSKLFPDEYSKFVDFIVK